MHSYVYVYHVYISLCYFTCGDQQPLWGQNACPCEFEGIFKTVVLVTPVFSCRWQLNLNQIKISNIITCLAYSYLSRG